MKTNMTIPNPPECQHWDQMGQGDGWKFGWVAGYKQGVEDFKPKTDPYSKTSLDKHDAQVVLFCKGHFDKILKELASEMSEIEAVKLFISERNAIEPKYISNNDVLNYFLINIVEPFVTPNHPRFMWKLIEDSSPQNSWKTGYAGGLRLNGQPGNIPYNYTEAMIYNLISMISLTEVKYLPGLTRQANKEWFRMELEKEIKKGN